MKKRGVFIALFVILLIGFISAIPFISFVNPTPASGTQTTGSSLIINATITGVSKLLEFVFNWQGTNYTLYDEDLILHLNLNNNSLLGENDTHVYDSSRAGHNGTIVGSILSSNGKYQGGISIDEDDEYINLSDHADFRGENFTISLWYNKTQTRIKEFSLSAVSTCILLHSGEIYCVGYNDYGQLGDGTTTNKLIPIKVLGGHNFSSIAKSGYAYSYHSCGVLHNGSALCWGRNDYGKLGNGNTTQMNSPTYVSGGYNFNLVSLGSGHSCGILQNGSVLCWGQNTYGQLGIGNETQMNTPTYVLGGYNFSSVSLGTAHSCGLLFNGSVLCWGNNDYGQLGIGNETQMNTPTYVLGGYNFSLVSLGAVHTCGLLHNGSALCWGHNSYGQLGNGNTTDMYAPSYVKGGNNFLGLVLKQQSSHGILTDGRILGWGFNLYWKLGFIFDSSIPERAFYKGQLFGKNTNSFKISSDFKGDTRIYVGRNYGSIDVNDGWNQITLSFNGTHAKYYLNGELNGSFRSPLFEYPTWITEDLLIGKDARGQIDEILMWNRTLSDDEIQKVYESSLQQRNHTSWEFYSTQTLPSVGTYTYKLFAKDSSG
jgi:hypothetical protein